VIRTLGTIAVALLVLLLPVGAVESNPDSVPAALQHFYAQNLRWSACGGTLQCTSLTAPLDWQHPTAGSISLAMVRQRATGVRLGSLLVNPGGPGASGVQFVTANIDDAVDSTLQKHFDIVGFDPRGVGASTPVICYDAKQLDEYLYAIVPGTIGSGKWIDAKTASAQAFAAACRVHTGALLAHVDTVSAARDLDLERAVLGDSKLNYLGYSYGTYLGTIYAGLYPHRVGRMVLDSAVDPWASGSADGLVDTSQEEGFEGDLRAYLTTCIAGKKIAIGTNQCAFGGSVATGMSAIAALLAQIDAKPISNSDGRMLGSATLAAAIYATYIALHSGATSTTCSSR